MLQLHKSNKHALTLSSQDVTRLLTDDSANVRIDMSQKIAESYVELEFDHNEAIIAEQIFRLLLRDTESRVRVTMAEQLKHSNHIPKDIVLSLARDIEEVALPMLQWSEVLTEEDLVELIASTGDMPRHRAISKRRRVPERVSEALLGTGHREVVRELLANHGARISDQSITQITEQYADQADVIETLAKRETLSVLVVEKLISKVSDALSETLQRKYNLASAAIQPEVDRTKETTTLQVLKRVRSDVEVEKLIDQLMLFKRLTPSLILNALCHGHWRFFEVCLAKLSRVPLENARILINDRGELGFKALYDKAELPTGMFESVRLLLDTVRELQDQNVVPTQDHYNARLAERLLQRGTDHDAAHVGYLVALIKRDILSAA